MEGRKSLKKLLAVTMTIVFTVTGITFMPRNTDAEITNWSTIPQGHSTVGDMHFWNEYGGNMVYNNTTNGRSVKRTGSGGNSYSFQVGIISYDNQGNAVKKDSNNNALVSGTSYNYTVTFDCTTGGGTLRLQPLKATTVTHSVTSGTNTISGTQTYQGINTGDVKECLYMEITSLTNGTVLENIDITITPNTGPTTPDPYPNTGTLNQETKIGNNGWTYFVKNANYMRYKGGTSFSDGPGFKVEKNNWTTKDFYTISPDYSLSQAGNYTVTLVNSEVGDTSQSWIEVYDASNDTKLYETTQKAVSGGGNPTTYEITNQYFSASSIYIVYYQNYSSGGTKDISANVQLISPETGTQPTQAPTSTTSDWINVPQNDDSYYANGWKLYAGSWDGGNLAYKDLGATTGKLKVVSSSGNAGTWGIQARCPMTVDDSKTYSFDIEYTSTSAGTMYSKIEGPEIAGSSAAAVGTNHITSINNHDSFSGSAEIGIIFELSGMPAGTIIEVKSITLTDITPTGPTEPVTEPGGFTPVTQQWLTVGNFQIFQGYDGRTMSYKGTGAYNDMQVKMKGTTGSELWSTQIGINVSGLTSGTQYDYSVVFTSNNATTMFAQVPGEGDPVQIDGIAVTSGSNTFSGTFTAGTNPAHGQIMFFPQPAPDGTIFSFTSVTVTPHSAPTPTQTQTAAPTTTTKAPTAAPTTTESGWIDIPNAVATKVPNSTTGPWTLFALFGQGGDWGKLAYKSTGSGIGDTRIKLVNASGWLNWSQTATLEDYCTGKMTPGHSYNISITFNSTEASAAKKRLRVAVDNTEYYFKNIVAGNNTLVIEDLSYNADSTNISFDFGEMTIGSIFTISNITFTENVETSTATPEPTTEAPIVDPDIDLTGYQINTAVEGFRMVGQVEPQINNSNVEEFGFVYGLSKIYKPSTDSFEDTGITDADMVTTDATYVKHYPITTEAGILDPVMGHSTTATYFAKTMTFGKKNKAAYISVYKIRVYAVLANGSTVYSDVHDFTVNDIAEELYQGCLMNSLDKHNYLYNTILTKVNPNYEEVPYEYSHKIAKPGEIDS